MKLFDIGATIEAAVRGLAQFDLDFLTVHGDPHVVTAAKEGAGGSGLKILAVTVPDILDRTDLDAALIRDGRSIGPRDRTRRPRLQAGADGVIASPHEAALIRALPEADGKLIVTPGVRPAGSDLGRPETHRDTGEAIAAGADHIVVGRPVWQATNPGTAARTILETLP
jgi:orotidine-5'-phosphate decarboxylase